MSVQESRKEFDYEDWGDGRVVSHWGDDPGKWVMYDPEDELLDLDNWQ